MIYMMQKMDIIYKLNPTWKAHKQKPKIGPIFSSKSSPSKPTSKMSSEGCKILIFVIQKEFKFETYKKYYYEPTDSMYTFDFTSF